MSDRPNHVYDGTTLEMTIMATTDLGAELAAIHAYEDKHGGCDIQQHPWQAVFGAGFQAGVAEVERLQEAWEIADSVAQIAAHDRDEALENFSRVEQEYERLQSAARSILWMAEKYAEGGGRGGPEMRDYEAAAEIIGED